MRFSGEELESLFEATLLGEMLDFVVSAGFDKE